MQINNTAKKRLRLNLTEHFHLQRSQGSPDLRCAGTYSSNLRNVHETAPPNLQLCNKVPFSSVISQQQHIGAMGILNSWAKPFPL